MKLHAALVAAVAVMMLPASALAATASASEGYVQYDAAPGEANDLQVSESPPDVYTITDQGAVIVAGEGCVQLGDHQVRCSPAPRDEEGHPSSSASIYLGDLADTAEVTQGPRSIVVHGGTGADRLTACIDCWARLVGDEGDDVLQAGDAGFPSYLSGGGGADAITGGRGVDYIDAGPGDDTIASGAGNDLIVPDSGDDRVDAGGGRDQLRLADATNPVVVDLRAGTLTGYGTKTLIGIENVHGTRYADRLYGTRASNFLFGAPGADLLVGRGGRDVLSAAYGDDRLLGGFGADRLYGHLGADLLVGGRGDDILVGGVGNDRMFGWSGADTLRAREPNHPRRDLVVGGRGVDRARVDAKDVVRSIEIFL